MEFKPRLSVCFENEQTLKGTQACVCPHLLLIASFLEWKWTVFLYTSGLLRINVSNLNNPGKGYIDRMIYDCPDAVIEINVNELRYLVEYCSMHSFKNSMLHNSGPQEAACQCKYHGFLQHTNLILLIISKNNSLGHECTKLKFFFILSSTLNSTQNKVTGR